MPLSDRLRRFRKAFLSTFLNQVLIFGIQFASSILIVRTLEIHSYATYVLFNTTLNLASNLCNMGLRAYLTRFVPGATREKAKSILWAVMFVQFAATVILLLANTPLLLNADWAWMAKFKLDRLPFLFGCFAVILLLSYGPRQFSGFFRYLDEDHKRANRIQVVAGTAFPVFVILAWAIAGKMSLEFTLFGLAMSQVVSIVTITLMSRDLAGFPGIPAVWDEAKAALRYSWPFAFLPVATQLIELSNRFFLAGYGTAVDLAKFSFNYGICAAVFMLINTSMGFTFFPKALRMFNQGKRKEAERLNLKGVLACSVLVTGGFLAFWIVSPLFFRIMHRESLRLEALPYALICVSFIAQVLSGQGNFILQAYNLRISNVGITLTGTVLSLLLNSLLIPRYHVTGAALALGGTAVVLLGLNLLPALKNRSAPVPEAIA